VDAMTTEIFKLSGNVVGISSGDSSSDACEESLVVHVKGAGALNIELQLPNGHEWSLGQQVVVLVVAIHPDSTVPSIN
jgi:hypothetical protein